MFRHLPFGSQRWTGGTGKIWRTCTVRGMPLREGPLLLKEEMLSGSSDFFPFGG